MTDPAAARAALAAGPDLSGEAMAARPSMYVAARFPDPIWYAYMGDLHPDERERLHESVTEALDALGFIRDAGEVNEPGTEHLSPSEPGQGSHLSGSSSGDERDSPATKREDEVPGSLTSARMARPTVNDVSTIFNDTWSDLPVRFYLDGEEIRFDGGPEERTVARDSGLPGEPEWYEVYFVRIPDVTGKVLGQASAAGEETS